MTARNARPRRIFTRLRDLRSIRSYPRKFRRAGLRKGRLLKRLPRAFATLAMRRPLVDNCFLRSARARAIQVHGTRAGVGKDMMKCISRESNPGHIDGNDVFYH